MEHVGVSVAAVLSVLYIDSGGRGCRHWAVIERLFETRGGALRHSVRLGTPSLLLTLSPEVTKQRGGPRPAQSCCFPHRLTSASGQAQQALHVLVQRYLQVYRSSDSPPTLDLT